MDKSGVLFKRGLIEGWNGLEIQAVKYILYATGFGSVVGAVASLLS